jgi:hypothetical protein
MQKALEFLVTCFAWIANLLGIYKEETVTVIKASAEATQAAVAETTQTVVKYGDHLAGEIKAVDVRVNQFQEQNKNDLSALQGNLNTVSEKVDALGNIDVDSLRKLFVGSLNENVRRNYEETVTA